jgi:integrase
MDCIYCSRELPDGAAFCAFCGKKQIKKAKTTKRANGEGSVRKMPNGKWRAEVVLWYYWDDEKAVRRPKKISKAGFAKKADASAYLPTLREEGYRKWGKSPAKGKKRAETFEEVYALWLPTHQASKSTIDCYKAAFKHFFPVHSQRLDDIFVDDLQECLDECSKGKRTKENMKALCGLIYKYAVPRQYVAKDLILSQYLTINEKAVDSKRTGLTKDELKRLEEAIGIVPFADYIFCMCYLGFRPSEALDLRAESYNRKEKYFIGGAKTEAGKDRIVPVSPKIQKYIDALVKNKIGGYVFCNQDGDHFNLRRFREDYFAPALEAIGISEQERLERLLTPHCCRHTFANLLRDTQGADKNKLALIGHTSEEMLRHYQDADLDGLRKIVNDL